MSIWFTSDFHLNHTNIAGAGLSSSWKTGYRAFDTVAAMNEAILKNLNEVVNADDTLFFLGDFAFGDKQAIPGLRARINCRDIHLIYGNHDKWIREAENRGTGLYFTSCRDYREWRVPKGLPGAGRLVVMSHYPMTSWNEVGRGAFMLHGHCHGNFTGRGKTLDVGVDTNRFRPYSWEDVYTILEERPTVAVDHHDSSLRGW